MALDNISETAQDIVNQTLVAWIAYGQSNAQTLFAELCKEHKLVTWEQVALADRIKKEYLLRKGTK